MNRKPNIHQQSTYGLAVLVEAVAGRRARNRVARRSRRINRKAGAR